MSKKTWENMPKISVSWGEVFDKLTILNIKLQKITQEEKIKNIKKEKTEIENTIGDMSKFPQKIFPLIEKLYDINLRLWDVEDSKRAHEQKQVFDDEFIQLAREVYIKNDARALIKKNINILTCSTISEEKSHFKQ